MFNLTIAQIQELIIKKGIMGDHIDIAALIEHLAKISEVLEFLRTNLPNKGRGTQTETVHFLEEKEVPLNEFIAKVNTEGHIFVFTPETNHILQLINRYRIDKNTPFQVTSVVPPPAPSEPVVINN